MEKAEGTKPADPLRAAKKPKPAVRAKVKPNGKRVTRVA